MSFTTEKTNTASNRFMLVKIRPSKVFEFDDLTQTTLQTYEFTWSGAHPQQLKIYEKYTWSIYSMDQSGFYTETSSSTPSAGQWYFNETTGLIKFKLQANPSSVDDVEAYVYFDVNLTGEIYRYIGSDPESPDDDVVEWLGIINKYPSITSSIKNAAYGVITSQLSSLSIYADSEILSVMGKEYSWQNKAVSIWACVNSVSNIKRIKGGVISSVKFSNGSINIQLVQDLRKLDAAPTESYSVDYYNPTVPASPGVPGTRAAYYVKTKDNGARPYLFGIRSYQEFTERTDINGTFDFVSGLIAYPGYVEASKTTSTNRSYDLGQIVTDTTGNTIAPQSMASISGTSHFTVGLNKYVKMVATHNLLIGEKVKWVSTGDRYGTVVANQVASGGGTENLFILFDDPAAPNFTTLVPASYPAIVIKQGAVNFYPQPVVDYTLSVSSTTIYTDPNFTVEKLSITFVNAFETRIGMSAIDPEADTICYAMRPGQQEDHAGAIMRIAALAGLDIDTTSFTQASSDLTANVWFNIPNTTGSSFRTYKRSIESVLKSTLGYVDTDTDGKITYGVFTAPAAGTPFDKINIIDSSFSWEFIYDDTIGEVLFTNEHISQELDIQYSLTNYTFDNSNTQAFADMDLVTKYEHVLDDFNAHEDRFLGFFGRRRLLVNFKTTFDAYELEPGDDITVTHAMLPQAAESINLKITSITKTTETIDITAEGLEGL